MNNRDLAVDGRIDILQLYELAMSIGQSLDLRENCDAFFRVLIRRKNLGLVSLWLWDQGSDEKPKHATLAYISPGFRRTVSFLARDHDSFVALEEAACASIAADNPLFRRIAVERVPESGMMAFFSVGAIGVVKLFFFERSELLSVIEENQLESLFRKFFVSVQACIEHERLRQQMVLNNRLILAINQSEEQVLILNGNHEIEYCNEAFCKNSGLNREEIKGHRLETILKSDSFLSDLSEIRKTLLADGRWRGQIRYMADNKELHCLDVLVNVVFSGNKEIEEFIILAKDITQEIAFEDRRRQSQKLEAMGTLAGGIAHNFNNILLVVMGNIELVSAGNLDSEMAKKCLADAYEASQKAQELVKRILLFSRNDKPVVVPLPLDSVVKDSLRMLRPMIPERIRIELFIDFRGYVKSDVTQLYQVMTNLITNAYKSITGAGKITIRLSEVSLEDLKTLNFNKSESLWICISITDTGCGINPEIIGRIFDPFFTTRSTGDGTGLGLSVVHGIIQQLGGTVAVESIQGSGSCFKVFLPLTDVDEYLENKNEVEGISKTCRLMVVDDEKMICALYRRGLTRAGFAVTVFDDSLKALEAFKADPDAYDVVVTDMMMPDLTGDKLAEKMLAIKPEQIIILCSGYLKNLDEEELYRAGIRAFIEKPLIVDELVKVIGSFL